MLLPTTVFSLMVTRIKVFWNWGANKFLRTVMSTVAVAVKAGKPPSATRTLN
jgi:hypothetical protein